LELSYNESHFSCCHLEPLKISSPSFVADSVKREQIRVTMGKDLKGVKERIILSLEGRLTRDYAVKVGEEDEQCCWIFRWKYQSVSKSFRTEPIAKYNAYNNKHPLRSNTKCYGDTTR
jgi:DUF971 family protein